MFLFGQSVFSFFNLSMMRPWNFISERARPIMTRESHKVGPDFADVVLALFPKYKKSTLHCPLFGAYSKSCPLTLIYPKRLPDLFLVSSRKNAVWALWVWKRRKEVCLVQPAFSVRSFCFVYCVSYSGRMFLSLMSFGATPLSSAGLQEGLDPHKLGNGPGCRPQEKSLTDLLLLSLKVPGPAESHLVLPGRGAK